MSDRARQFLPFDALKGFKDLIKEVERVKVNKKELTEENIEKLSKTILSLEKGMMVKVIYFEQDEYLKLEGIVSKIDISNRFIMIVKKRISLDDIFEICLDDIFEIEVVI